MPMHVYGCMSDYNCLLLNVCRCFLLLLNGLSLSMDNDVNCQPSVHSSILISLINVFLSYKDEERRWVEEEEAHMTSLA